MNIHYQLEGYDVLNRKLRTLEQSPQKMVNKAARLGIKPVLQQARSNAPVDSGNLKRALQAKAERSRTRGKKVYRVIVNPSKGNFSGESSNGKRYFYPASQEFGFFARNGRYIPGFRYLGSAMSSQAKSGAQIVVNTMLTEIDKIARG